MALAAACGPKSPFTVVIVVVEACGFDVQARHAAKVRAMLRGCPVQTFYPIAGACLHENTAAIRSCGLLEFDTVPVTWNLSSFDQVITTETMLCDLLASQSRRDSEFDPAGGKKSCIACIAADCYPTRQQSTALCQQGVACVVKPVLSVRSPAPPAGTNDKAA